MLHCVAHAFLSNKWNQSCPESQMGQLWTEILWLEKLSYLKFPQIFPRTVNICDMHKSNTFFYVSLDRLGEINFRWKLRLRASFFSFENCCLVFRQKKEGRRLWVHLENLVGGRGGGQKPPVTDLSHKHLAKWLL